MSRTCDRCDQVSLESVTLRIGVVASHFLMFLKIQLNRSMSFGRQVRLCVILAFEHVDAETHHDFHSFAMEVMTCCYLGWFAKWAQMTFSLL
jgi:hypothetical protein